MQTVFNFLVRVVMVAAGLLFAASLLMVTLLLLVIWGLRSLWARITGQAISPFVMRVDPRTGFTRMYRRGAAGVPPAADTRRSGDPTRPVRMLDVTDVEVKPPRAG